MTIQDFLHNLEFDVEDYKKKVDQLESDIAGLKFTTLEMVERRTDEITTNASEISTMLLGLLDQIGEAKEKVEEEDNQPEGVLA